jgi:D-alanine-D-alanine ligase
MTPTSLLPQEAAAVGIDYDTLCDKLVNMALAKKTK